MKRRPFSFYHYGLMDCFLLSNVIVHAIVIHFNVQFFPNLASGNPFKLVLVSFRCISRLWGLPYFLAYKSILHVHLLFFLSLTYNQPIPQMSYFSFLWQGVLLRQRLDAKCGHCYCGVTAPRILQQAKLINTIHVSILHTHMCVYI